MRKHHRRSIDENKRLVEKYPFLRPVDWRTFEDLKFYDYTTTYADDMEGWWDAFGEMMCDEIKEELIKYDYLEQFRVVQVKEKYGELRFYHNGCPKGSRIDEIIDKYSELSRNICVCCGKPDVPMINDGIWISPYCRECCDEKELWDTTVKSEENHRLGEKMVFRPNADSYTPLILDIMVEKVEPTTTEMSNEMSYTQYQNGNAEKITLDISKEANEIRRRYRLRMSEE